MDAGVGVKAYAVIEQGKIGQILSSKPTERRQLIEEAAGVSKYKSRRRAAELKLEAAQQNLTRIDDIVFELEKQRSALKRQAAKAARSSVSSRRAHAASAAWAAGGVLMRSCTVVMPASSALATRWALSTIAYRPKSTSGHEFSCWRPSSLRKQLSKSESSPHDMRGIRPGCVPKPIGAATGPAPCPAA